MRRILLGGGGNQAVAIARQIRNQQGAGVQILGCLDDSLPPGTWVGRPSGSGDPLETGLLVRGHPREAAGIARQLEVDVLVVVPAALTWESQRFLTSLPRVLPSTETGLEVRLAPTQYDLSAATIEPAPLGYVPLVRMEPTRVRGGAALLRASLDTGLALLTLLFAAPFVLIVLVRGVLSRNASSLIQTHPVLGGGGRVFTLRLLSKKLTRNPVLRGYTALPSVLAGHLSFVGPRPMTLAEAASQPALSDILLAVSPGLTGPWRLLGPSSSLEEQLFADVWWVRNWSPWQHLFVLFQTLRRGGATTEGINRWDAPHAPTAEDRSPFP